MHAQVPPSRQTERQDRAAKSLRLLCLIGAAEVTLPSRLNKLQLLKSLLHFDDCARAIHQFKARLLLLDEGENEAEKADGLAGACRHLQNSVTCVFE